MKGGGKVLDEAVAQARTLGVRAEAIHARSRASTVARAVLDQARRGRGVRKLSMPSRRRVRAT